MNFAYLELSKKQGKVGDNKAVEMDFLAFFSAKKLFIDYSFDG